MASLRTSSLLLLSHSSSSSTSKSSRISAALHFPRPIEHPIDSMLIGTNLMDQLRMRNSYPQGRLDLASSSMIDHETNQSDASTTKTQNLYLILEEVSDRIEMHINIGKQRENWNSLLLNSINMMTLTATALTALGGGGGASTILFGAATAMLLIMNKIQPSQLAEEQRNAVRLLKELKSDILEPTKADRVEEMMEKVLALDRAYPLPLLGKMLEKFPKKLEPAVWWPKPTKKKLRLFPSSGGAASYNIARKVAAAKSSNGWSEELEVEMRAIAEVLKSKDEADYLRLGNIALNTNKVLAISGPLLTGVAAAASAFSGGAAAAALAGAVAAAVNTLEHGGQVGMLVEMYRNCAGFFRMMEESIESTLEETDLEKRENGELFERKVALKLGRSLSQLRDLARKSVYSTIVETEVDEFGSKLF